MLADPDGSMGAITIDGQGGYAQHRGEETTAGCTYTGFWNLSATQVHSCGMPTDNTWCTPTEDNNRSWH